MPSDAQLYAQHRQGMSYNQIARAHGLKSVDSVRSRVSRARRAEETRLTTKHGAPWRLPPGEYVVTGDYQIDTHSAHFVDRMLAVAATLHKPRALIIAGDFINADAFSTYDQDVPLSPFSDEVDAGRAIFAQLLRVFGRIYWLMGNHERRVSRRTRAALQPRHLWALLCHDDRVQVSVWGHCVIANDNGHDWRITHGSEYSVNQSCSRASGRQRYNVPT